MVIILYYQTLQVDGVITTSDGMVITTADNTDTLSLISTDADANSGPNLRLYRNSGSPADNDAVGDIQYEGRNDNSQDVIYASLAGYIDDASDGTEDGIIHINSMVGGTLVNRMSVLPTATVFNEGSVDVDFRVEGNSDANLLFVEAGTDRVGIGTNSPGALLDVDGTLDTTNLTVAGAQGSDGQVLTSTGSGVGWEDASGGGATAIDGLSDAVSGITNFTN